MKNTILKKILLSKQNWLAYRKKTQPLSSFQNKITKTTRNLKKSLQKNHPSFILELKKASPSLGIIRKDFNILHMINIYKKYANAISVLTDTEHFKGKFEFLPIVRSNTSKPILCKDFFIDPYQVYLARYYQADAILLILSILSNEQYYHLSKIARSMNMGVITEINNASELKRAIFLKSKIMGINNRNLDDFTVDINKTKVLAPLIPKKTIIISESGINNYKTVRKLSKFVNGFLIGSSLMKKSNLDLATRKIIFGNNKICGLTRLTDAKISRKIGAVYGGMIFITTSPRKISFNIAKKIIKMVDLKYVGIFQNEKIDLVAFTAKILALHAVQLHGDENQLYINELRKKLPVHIKIWKAFKIKNTIPLLNFNHVKYYVYDNYKGGSGISFNWNLLKKPIPENILLAGGLNVNNCVKASLLGFNGLDFNSGLEILPGIKDHNKMFSTFKKLKNYSL